VQPAEVLAAAGMAAEQRRAAAEPVVARDVAQRE
jgi:hypothetical protein